MEPKAPSPHEVRSGPRSSNRLDGEACSGAKTSRRATKSDIILANIWSVEPG